MAVRARWTRSSSSSEESRPSVAAVCSRCTTWSRSASEARSRPSRRIPTAYDGSSVGARRRGVGDNRAMDLGLTDRAAIVTGGSRGIGLRVARRLVAEGARVLLVGRGEPALRDAAADVDRARADLDRARAELDRA